LAMLVLLMTLGEVVFNSRAVGRIAAVLFFVPTTLSYLGFLRSQPSLRQALTAITHLNHWLVSGYPYNGENVGTWSLSIFYVQRHFLVGIGILLLALVFLVEFFQERSGAASSITARSETIKPPQIGNLLGAQNSLGQISSSSTKERIAGKTWRETASFIFTGFLLGLLPLFNSPGFVAAFVIAVAILVLLPFRICVLSLLIMAAVVGLPQIAFVFLRGHEPTQWRQLIHWGLVVENPTLWRVLSYFSYTFGTKFLLGLIAAVVVAKVPRRLFFALLILPVLAFSTR